MIVNDDVKIVTFEVQTNMMGGNELLEDCNFIRGQRLGFDLIGSVDISVILFRAAVADGYLARNIGLGSNHTDNIKEFLGIEDIAEGESKISCGRHDVTHLLDAEIFDAEIEDIA